MRYIEKYIRNPVTIRIFTVVLNFIANVLINRSLGIAMKGQLTLIQNYANFAQLCFNLGICYAYPTLIKKFGQSDAKNHIITITWIQTGICLAGSVAVLAYNPSVENIFSVLLFLAMLCNGQIVFVALIDDIIKRNLILLWSTFGYIILNALAIVFLRGNVYVVVGILCVKYIVETIICSVKYHYCILKSPKCLKKDEIAVIFRIGIPTAIVAALISCNYNIAIFLLDWLKCDDVQVGMFGIAYSLSNMMWFVPDAFKEMVYNRTAREDEYRFVLKYIALNMVICMIICVGFAVLGNWFLIFVYGEEYAVAYNVCLTLFIGIVPMVAFKLIHPIYINDGKVKPVVLLLSITVLVNIALGLILISAKGALGAALACVGSYCVCGVLFFVKFYFDYCRKPQN